MKKSNQVFTCLGATNQADYKREDLDFYATEPKAIDLLLEKEQLINVWECACGKGHLAERLKDFNILGKASDIVDRGYGEVQDFLSCNETWVGDILTNPPYSLAKDFVLKGLELVPKGRKVCMLLKLQFLASSDRYKELFCKYPPKVIYVSSKRIQTARNGNFDYMEVINRITGKLERIKTPTNAMDLGWFIWEKGYIDFPVIHWINY